MKKVLIIQLTRMGDILQTIPMMVRLREEYPSVEITFLCVEAFAEILRYTPLINRFIKVTPLEAVKLAKGKDQEVLSSLKKHPFLNDRFDSVINLTHDASSAEIGAYVNADQKAGRIERDSSVINICNLWGKYLFAIVKNREENSFNIVDIHVGMAGIKHRPVRNYLKGDPRSEKRVMTFLLKQNVSENTPIVTMHLGANKLHRTWPVEHFASLAAKIVHYYGAVIVLTGSEKEKPLADNFIMWWQKSGFDPKKIINTTGITKIHDLVAVIRHSKLLITNDTGPIHIASALNIPTIGIYLSTAYPGETAPYGENHYIACPTMSCYPCENQSEEFDCHIKCRYAVTPEGVLPIVKKIFGEDLASYPEENDIFWLKSRFLANGTILYEPLSVSGSSPSKLVWTKKIISRILWERVLGLEIDPTIVKPMLNDEKFLEDLNRAEIGIKDLLKELIPPHKASITLLQRKTSPFSQIIIDFLWLNFFYYKDRKDVFLSETREMLEKMLKQVAVVKRW